MKQILLIITSLVFFSHSYTQTTCHTDTIEYTLSKATSIRSIGLSTTSPEVGQYYDAPQALSISGFSFYAWAAQAPSNSITCLLYLANSDSLPTGSPLASVTMSIDSSFGSGSLSDLRKEAVFPSPVVVSTPYVLVVRNNTPSNVAGIVASEPNIGDGQGEWLSNIKLGSTWTRSTNITLGGVPFDADFLLLPTLSYSLDAAFSASPNCLSDPGLVNFNSSSSPVLSHRMYNVAEFLDTTVLSYEWDFGDGSLVENTANAAHFYGSTGSYQVNYTNNLFSWASGVCVDEDSSTITVEGELDFSYSVAGQSVTLSNNSTGGFTSYLWDMGDGSILSNSNPTYTYTSPGVYTVCLSASGGCGTTFRCQSVSTLGCGLDTIAYVQAKATSYRTLGLANSAYGQYYDAPQPITIGGITFFGFAIDQPETTLELAIYALGTDSLPTGTALASTTISIDSSTGTGFLSAILKTATLPTPITVNGAYFISIRNNSSDNVGIILNDWSANDGQGEWLANYEIGGNWVRSYDISIGGLTADADIILEPILAYELNADFSTSVDCSNDAVLIQNSSPILANRMYNQAAYSNVTNLSYAWDFGDGNTAYTTDTAYTYANSGSYDVTLSDTLYGWFTNCVAQHTETIDVGGAKAAFSYTENGLSLDFTDETSANVFARLWNFGDGSSSTTQNPSHTYANAGIYEVCLIIIDLCGSDTLCQTINVGNFVNCGKDAFEPNDSIEIAAPLPRVGASAVLCGMDDEDWYHFRVEADRPHTRIVLSHSEAALIDLDIEDDLGPLIGYSSQTGDDTKQILLNSLTTGDYYIRLGTGATVSAEEQYHLWVHQRDLPFSGTVPNREEVRDEAEIVTELEVYPNPFRHNIQLAFQLSESAEVSIQLHDALGREVATYWQQETKEVGYYELNWALNELSVGVYFLHLQLGEQLKRIKLIKED